MVLLAVLASVHFWDDDAIPPILAFPWVKIKVPADGRCLWSSLWVATVASPAQVLSWSRRPRNQTGFSSGGDIQVEKNLVWDWLKQFLDKMNASTRERVEKSIPAEDPDLVPWFCLLNCATGNFVGPITALNIAFVDISLFLSLSLSTGISFSLSSLLYSNL